MCALVTRFDLTAVSNYMDILRAAVDADMADDVVRILTEECWHPNNKTVCNLPVLMYATKVCAVNTCAALLKLGASMRCSSSSARSPNAISILTVICFSPEPWQRMAPVLDVFKAWDLKELQSIVDSTQHMCNTPLYTASVRRNILLARELIALGADVNCKGYGLHSGLLHTLVMQSSASPLEQSPDECFAFFEYLLDNTSVDIERTDANGLTALHRAVERGRRSHVEALLSRGANPLAVSVSGESPLDFAKNAHHKYPGLFEIVQSYATAGSALKEAK